MHHYVIRRKPDDVIVERVAWHDAATRINTLSGRHIAGYIFEQMRRNPRQRCYVACSHDGSYPGRGFIVERIAEDRP